MPVNHDEQSLADIVKDGVLSQVNSAGMANIFVAQPRWLPDLTLPDGMTATRKPIRGKRVAVRTKHGYGKSFTKEAVWPEDNLQSMRVPYFFRVMTFPKEMQIADYALHCQPGHGIIVPPGVPFSYQINTEQATGPTTPWEMLQLTTYNEGVICWHTKRWSDDKGERQVQEQSCSIPYSQVSLYLNNLVEEATVRREHGEIVCNSLIKILFSLLHRELQRVPTLKLGAPFDTPLEQGVHTIHPIRRAEEYIERNLREPLVIDDVARHVGMSRTAFTTQFRVRTDKTFVNYLQDLRFNAACELLRGGGLGISQVAAAVGLKHDRIRVLFQEREGISPTEYRRRHLPDK